MKEYFLIIRNMASHDEGWPGERRERFLKECEGYIEGLKAEGKLIAAQPLEREGVVLSGSTGAWRESPLPGGGEIQVGYYHIRARDLAEAVEIAKRNPEFSFGKTARVEVRPVKAGEEETGYDYPGR